MTTPATAIMRRVMTSMKTDAALMAGLIARRINDRMKIGSVDPVPLTKTVIKNSSRDKATARIAAPMMVGPIIGIVTSQNAWVGVAPRSLAASSYDRSKYSKRDRAASTKKGRVKSVWP